MGKSPGGECLWATNIWEAEEGPASSTPARDTRLYLKTNKTEGLKEKHSSKVLPTDELNISEHRKLGSELVLKINTAQAVGVTQR